MDQKNTIIKCAIPDCLFNYCGTCAQDVITIDVDGKCATYCETEQVVNSFNELGNIYPASTEEIQIYENAKKMLKAAGVTILPPMGEVKRGQRAQSNFIEDGWIDPEIVKEVCKPFSDWDYAATPDICKTCKKVVFGQDCKWKDAAYGIWTCYEEIDNLCLSCEHCDIHGECGLTTKPMKDINDRCCRFSKR